MTRSFSISAILCLFVLLFLLPACREEIPHVDGGEEPPPVVEEEDPILQQEVPGAYGVPGGTFQLTEGWQTGILHYGSYRQNFRLVQPSRAHVVSLSGLPHPLAEGMEVQALYRETERGLTRVCIPYCLLVLRVQDNKVWLKESDQTYFVLEE